MSEFALPADTLQFYNDGPDWPTTPLLQEAERAYREAYAEGARDVAEWDMPNPEMIDEAWQQRRQARCDAELIVPSAVVFGEGPWGGEQVIYRAGHEVAASRTRGRCHALELAKQLWWELSDVGVTDEKVIETIIKPWVAQVQEWARSEINPATISPPPRPEEFLTEVQNRMLNHAEEPVLGNLISALPAKSVRQLLNEYPSLRQPVIHGLLREGETMNVIASPKVGKSWLVVDLALAVATGRSWLETFECEAGDVLIVDNELHQETSANRIPKVMKARRIPHDDIADHVFVANVRGGLKDIFGLAGYFQQLTPGRFKLIVLDAFYRFMPRDADENDNGTMSQVYNHLDGYAARLGCSFVLVHHSSKGNQSGKSVTDVGAGAGSQSRATDTHLVLRPHEEPECVVIDAAVRSWPPIEPRVLRWTFPVWTPDDTLDPTALLSARARRRRVRAQAREQSHEPEWTPEKFVEEFITDEPELKAQITELAKEQGLSTRKAGRLLRDAEEAELVYRWKFGVTKPVQFATRAQPSGSFVRARTPP